MNKLRELTETRKKSHSRFLKLDSKVYMKMIEMEMETYKEGALSGKEKELIAVGISVVINCESCMQWHIEQAVNKGATEREILEAIEVGIEMGGGPASVSARFALEVMDDVIPE
ncbi:carboxymuconolactone decarboxylase family protein [candidate division KSB1 bacterium]